jgi:hypothetical protein
MALDSSRVRFNAYGLPVDGSVATPTCNVCGTQVWVSPQESMIDRRHQQSHGIVMIPAGMWCETCAKVVHIVEGKGGYFQTVEGGAILRYLCREELGIRRAISLRK